jgi:hypothetical protein
MAVSCNFKQRDYYMGSSTFAREIIKQATQKTTDKNEWL